MSGSDDPGAEPAGILPFAAFRVIAYVLGAASAVSCAILSSAVAAYWKQVRASHPLLIHPLLGLGVCLLAATVAQLIPLALLGEQRAGDDGGVLCQITALSLQFFQLGGVLWYGVIAMMSITVVRGKKLWFTAGWQHLFVWSAAAAAACAVYASGSIGRVGPRHGICWVSSDHPWMRLFCFAIFVVIVFVICVVALHHIWMFRKRTRYRRFRSEWSMQADSDMSRGSSVSSEAPLMDYSIEAHQARAEKALRRIFAFCAVYVVVWGVPIGMWIYFAVLDLWDIAIDTRLDTSLQQATSLCILSAGWLDWLVWRRVVTVFLCKRCARSRGSSRSTDTSGSAALSGAPPTLRSRGSSNSRGPMSRPIAFHRASSKQHSEAEMTGSFPRTPRASSFPESGTPEQLPLTEPHVG